MPAHSVFMRVLGHVSPAFRHSKRWRFEVSGMNLHNGRTQVSIFWGCVPSRRKHHCKQCVFCSLRLMLRFLLKGPPIHIWETLAEPVYSPLTDDGACWISMLDPFVFPRDKLPTEVSGRGFHSSPHQKHMHTLLGVRVYGEARLSHTTVGGSVRSSSMLRYFFSQNTKHWNGNRRTPL